MYLSDGICLAVLREAGGSRTVDHCGHNRRGRVGGHWTTGGEKLSRGASAERRIPAGTGRIRSNTAAHSCLTRITGRRFVVMKRVMRECSILAMSMMLVMPSLSDNGQGCNTHNGKLDEHFVQSTGGYTRENVYRKM